MQTLKHLVFFSLIFLTACSANQIRLSTELSPSTNPSVFQLKRAITIKASNANASNLNAGTHWREVGNIEQGVVYRTKDQVVVVNSFNVHEGYIVVSDSRVVGYYLPVEKSFVEVVAVPVTLVEME